MAEPFDAVYARYMPALTRYCRRLLRNAEDAEDAAQNAMLKAMRALEQGERPHELRPWLYRIAHNEAITLTRRRLSSEPLETARFVRATGAEDAVAVRARLAELLDDIQALSPHQREALVLRELAGRSYREIAAELETTEAAAQQTVFEARSSLAQFGEGRALACEGVQRSLSDADHRWLRTRRARAHLRGCACCSAFERSLRVRRGELGLLFPGLGGGSLVAGLLGDLLGGRALRAVVSSTAGKAAAVGVLAAAGGAAVVAERARDRPASAPPAAPAAAASRPAAAPAAAPRAATPQARPGRSGPRAAARPGRGTAEAAGGSATAEATEATAPRPAAGDAGSPGPAGRTPTAPSGRAPTAPSGHPPTAPARRPSAISAPATAIAEAGAQALAPLAEVPLAAPVAAEVQQATGAVTGRADEALGAVQQAADGVSAAAGQTVGAPAGVLP